MPFESWNRGFLCSTHIEQGLRKLKQTEKHVFHYIIFVFTKPAVHCMLRQMHLFNISYYLAKLKLSYYLQKWLDCNGAKLCSKASENTYHMYRISSIEFVIVSLTTEDFVISGNSGVSTSRYYMLSSICICAMQTWLYLQRVCFFSQISPLNGLSAIQGNYNKQFFFLTFSSRIVFGPVAKCWCFFYLTPLLPIKSFKVHPR